MKRFVLGLTVVISFSFGIMVALTALADGFSQFDMNNRFDTTGTGASGEGKAKVTGGLLDFEIKAKDLQAKTKYEVHVAIGAEGDLSFNPVTIHRFRVTTNKEGEVELEIEEFSLGLDPGTYRFDYVVTLPGVVPPPFILACEPFQVETIP